MKKIISALIAAFGLFAITSCAKDDGKTLYLANWTYYAPADVLKTFEEEFGVKVILEEYDSNETMYEKVSGGSYYDIVVPSQDFIALMIRNDELAPINQEIFTNKININPEVLAKATYDPEMIYAVPYYYGAAGISVNKTKCADYPRTWEIFADKRFAGHMSMLDDAREVMGDALAHLGFDISSTDDTELAAAKELIINQWKPNLVKFDADSFGKEFSEGNFWVVQGYPECVFGEVPEEKWDEIDYFIPEAGGPAYIDSMCILKKSKHQELANQFINFMHRPEIYVQFLDYFKFPCKVNTQVSDANRKNLLYPASLLDNTQLKYDVGEGKQKYNDIWDEIKF